MQCEDDERDTDDDKSFINPFIAEGLSSDLASEQDIPPPRLPNQTRLQAGKARREALKHALFKAKERWNHQGEE